MIINKIKVKNYKIFEDELIKFNKGINIFVGENDSGKSSLLEIIEIVTTGKLKGFFIEQQLRTNLFNLNKRKLFTQLLESGENIEELPTIEIEAYCENADGMSFYKGTQNSLGEDSVGISVTISFDSYYSERYKELLENKEIFDIPIEFYTVAFKYFSGEQVDYRKSPFKTLTIDTTKKFYNNELNKFINTNISNNLTLEDQINLSTIYRRNKEKFKNDDGIKNLNQKIKELTLLTNKSVQIDLEEYGREKWKSELTLTIDEIPFENIGYGSQNFAKIELAINNQKEDVNIILIEEPENNLTYSNMAKLINKIESSNKSISQIFISTHSSFVANKLGLDNIHIMFNGKETKVNTWPENTINYFKKLPGYDTLRLILATKAILVEGPTEELIVNRAYIDKYGHLPLDDGIDIIVTNALSFKRYCDIAISINKEVIILTDNDGDIQKNITDKYKDYLDKPNIKISYETNEELYTLELSVLEVNTCTDGVTKSFQKAISKIPDRKSMVGRTKKQMKQFMCNNKTEWALRVFEYEENIDYPEFIKNVL